MITSEQFDIALKVVTSYKTQLDKELENALKIRPQKIDISGDLKEKAFKALQTYYELHYSIVIGRGDLTSMDRHLLAGIDYNKMLYIKGFGRYAVYNFKEVMLLHGILDELD
jgi:hypothetical protein